jgi:hypothetical protein
VLAGKANFKVIINFTLFINKYKRVAWFITRCPSGYVIAGVFKVYIENDVG